MTLGPVRVMEVGVVPTIFVEEVIIMCDLNNLLFEIMHFVFQFHVRH